MTLLLDLRLITVQVRRKKSRSEIFFAPGEQEICSVRNHNLDRSQGGSGECTSALSRYPTPSTGPINQLPPVAAGSLSTFHHMAQLDDIAHAEDDSMISTSPEQTDSIYSRQVLPAQSLSSTIPTGQAPGVSNAQPANLVIHTQAVHCISADKASKSSGEGIKDKLPLWKTQFKIVLHLPDGSIKIRIAKLDTGSSVDVMSKRVADCLDMKMEPYYGEDVIPLGGAMTPLGQLTLDWHVMERSVTYTTTFLVLDGEDFDVLLSESTIGSNKFYTVNSNVFFVNRGYYDI